MERKIKAICLILTLMLTLSASAQKKSKVISTEFRQERLAQALRTIEKLSGTRVVFDYEDVAPYTVTITLQNVTAVQAVQSVLATTPLDYKAEGKYITVMKSAQKRRNPARAERFITGTVVDENHEPLPGATIKLSAQGESDTYAVTDLNGHYNLPFTTTNASVTATFLGYDAMTKAVGEHSVINFTLEPSAKAIKEVVVNGMFDQRKSTFTGSTVTFSKDELEKVGNQNLIKSLKNLDPSFQIVENLDMGSNPNAMPNLQLRGQTSFNIQGDYAGNANEPLFILDGFETSLEKIWDLDMNRIESVTLLKDAAAKAIYGSKAGNGVVVIQTIRPKSGEIRISYNGNLNIEAPDLKGYNLMNAQEKYDWEVSHHKYDDWQAMNNVVYADLLQKGVVDAIASGVDTYWLSKPLHTGIGQKHTVQLEGGDSKVRYLLGASYNNVAGVMKGSSRNTFDINSTLSYTYKNMVFRNLMDYTRNTSKESPYGSFSDYVTLEPYFAPYDENGQVKKLLGYEAVGSSGFREPVYNPLYNATLNTKNESAYTSFQDNFEMDWHINESWRATGKFSYLRTENSSDVFYPGSHTMFVEYDNNGLTDRKGRYTKGNGFVETISGQVGISWNHTFGLHSIFLNGNWNLESSNSKNTTVMAEGFGNDDMNDISMANYYYHDSHPTGTDSKTREIGLVGALNYSYADRYLFDASIRRTGSSLYGSDNHWGTFWSTGVGWNIHNEPFMKQQEIIKLLKLRYSIGYTGTQNFNPYQAHAMYTYGSTVYDGRMGAYLLGLPNTSLKWQKVYDNNWGIDLALGNWLTARFDYYIQNTSNLLSDITLPASTGFTTYKENMGEIQNKGVELNLGITPWRDNATRSYVTLTASLARNNNKIKKIYDIFKKANDDANASYGDDNLGYNEAEQRQLTTEEYNAKKTALTRPSTLYYEGCSMTAIWGMRSLGIDPMSGKELYLDKDGNITDKWSADDQVVIGDTNPKWHGTIGLSGAYKGFSLSVVASYKLGGDLYNQTLIDRVENITGFGNLDKRVNEVWANPGDHSLYRAVAMGQGITDQYVNITKPTSRFVQRNNEFYISSINVGYDFFRQAWLRKIGLEQLRVSFYTSDLVRFSSIKVERGLSYPFARTFSFAVNATF